MKLCFSDSDRLCAPLKIVQRDRRVTRIRNFRVQFPQHADAPLRALSYPALSPKELAGTHKARASGELNQIRSAKRSSLGSAFRARKRDSAATFPITLPHGVREVIRPASRISRYTRVAETSRRAGPKRRGRRERERGDKRGDGGALTLTLESRSRYTRVLFAYVHRVHYKNSPFQERRGTALSLTFSLEESSDA